jgi:DNA-binding response OmpR family regulator
MVEAIKRIAADAPNIVLLDLGLPDGDGKDVIRRAREWSDVPIIVLPAREPSTNHLACQSRERRCIVVTRIVN